jgi:hypothetical protein
MGRCTGCGNSLPAGARFCPLCGASAASGTPTQSMPAQPQVTQQSNTPYHSPSPYAGATAYGQDAPNNKGKIALAAGGGIIAVAIALFLLLKASGVLGAKPTETTAGSVLTAPQTVPNPAPVLQAPPVAAPSVKAPVLAPPKPVQNPMPEDVIAYLRWLKQFEKARRALKAKNEADLALVLGEMIKAPLEAVMKWDDPNAPTAMPTIRPETWQKLNGISDEWNKANALFQTYPPPNPCAPLAGSYQRMLQTVIGTQVKLTTTLATTLKSLEGTNGNANTDVQRTLQELYAEQNRKHMSRASDDAFVAADDALNRLRNQYTSMPEDIDKNHFNIADESRVSVPQAPMMPGM